MVKFLERITNTGGSKLKDQTELPKLISLNWFTLAFSVISLLFFIPFYLQGLIDKALYLLIFTTLYQFVFLFNKKGWFSFSKTYFVILSFGAIIFFRFLLGDSYYSELILISGVSVPFVIASKKDNFISYIGLVLGLGGFLYFIIFENTDIWGKLNNDNIYLSLACIVASFIVPFFVLRNFKQQQQNLENSLLIEADTQRMYNEELVKLLGERDILLKEIHHRVKNNMQVITSLLGLQSGFVKDAHSKATLKNSQHRINSMAMVHQMLYESHDLSGINFARYLSELTNEISNSFQGNNNKVTVNVECPDLFLNIDTSIPLGLMVNEIVTNAFKYAFQDMDKGSIDIKLSQISTEDKTYLLIIGDNGTGNLNEDKLSKSPSLGLRLIQQLVKQLDGSLSLIQDKPGTNYQINFKEIRQVS